MTRAESLTFRVICGDVFEPLLRPVRLPAGFHTNPVRVANTSTSLSSDQLFFEAGIIYDTFLARREAWKDLGIPLGIISNRNAKNSLTFTPLDGSSSS